MNGLYVFNRRRSTQNQTGGWKSATMPSLRADPGLCHPGGSLPEPVFHPPEPGETGGALFIVRSLPATGEWQPDAGSGGAAVRRFHRLCGLQTWIRQFI